MSTRARVIDEPDMKSTDEHVDTFKYQFGLDGTFQSEALPDACPKDQNTPAKCNYNLYAEQYNGTSFTTPRAKNRNLWVYRIVPSAVHEPFVPMPNENKFIVSDFSNCVKDPNQLRWDPFPLPKEATDFVQGIRTIMGAGSAEAKSGMAIHVYTCNTSMTHKKAFCNSDGDFLIVPQLNSLKIRTECGMMLVQPWEFCVIPRGIKFSVDLAKEGDARGYICEIFTHAHFQVPDLGPIGANGLADPRHFAYPTADYIDEKGDDFVVVQKYFGGLFSAKHRSCPFDVVAFHGNYMPYKYDTRKFCVINSVSYDHLDPSIFTVLTCQTTEPGVAVCDFVIFPPRYAVQKNTFRPPYYHKNCMSEFMGNVSGAYEAKPDGFLPGGGSLHSCMIGHGPDADSYKKYSKVDTSKPFQMPYDSLSFMFESTFLFKLTDYAMTGSKAVQPDYYKVWQGLEHEFTPECKTPK